MAGVSLNDTILRLVCVYVCIHAGYQMIDAELCLDMCVNVNEFW